MRHTEIQSLIRLLGDELGQSVYLLIMFLSSICLFCPDRSPIKIQIVQI